MLAQGGPATVVNTASEAGLVPTARMAPYTTSKFGVVGMSEALNAELAPRGIRVIAVCPGIINTAIVRTGIVRGEIAEIHDKAIAFYSKRGASPDVVAAAVLKAIDKPKLIVTVPKSHVLVPYLAAPDLAAAHPAAFAAPHEADESRLRLARGVGVEHPDPQGEQHLGDARRRRVTEAAPRPSGSGS